MFELAWMGIPEGLTSFSFTTSFKYPLGLVMKKNPPIAAVITLMFAQELGITDNIDLIRANILGMEIEAKEHTLESIKTTSAYMGCHYDIPFSDEFLQKILGKRQQLLELVN